MTSRPRSPALPFLVAILAWLVPGAGHLAIGQRARGTTIGVTILFLMAAGLFIGGVRVVEAPTFDRAHPMQYPQTVVREKPWFLGQFLAGPAAIGPMLWARGRGLPVSHARSSELGLLYTAIAGLLNLLAIIDASYRAARQEPAP